MGARRTLSNRASDRQAPIVAPLVGGTGSGAGAPSPGVAWVILRSTSALVQEAVSVGRPEHARGQPAGERAGGNEWFDTSVPAIVVLLLLGLALRLIIAYVLLPGSGFPTDLASFQGWSGQLVAQTPLGFYDKAGFLDYPPVYLLFLWVLGLSSRRSAASASRSS
jgi:hypothetical protein